MPMMQPTQRQNCTSVLTADDSEFGQLSPFTLKSSESDQPGFSVRLPRLAYCANSSFSTIVRG